MRLEDLDDAWWAKSIPRLLDYARIKVQQRTWMGLRGGPPPRGNEAEDIVQAVLEAVLGGNRVWNTVEYPDPYLYLKSQVDSVVSNLVRSKENRKHRRASDAGEYEKGRYNLDAVLSTSDTPDDTVLELAEEESYDERLWAFIDSLSDEPELQAVVVSAADGNVKRREIAKALKITDIDLDNRKRRLKRRRGDYQRREDF